jgi:hypothetical protein
VRQLLGLLIFTILTARFVEASLETPHPVNVLAPLTLAVLTLCTMCIAYLLRPDD